MPETDMFSLQVLIPLHMHTELGKYSTTHNMAISSVVREAIAAYLDISSEYTTKTLGRPRKYKTEAERLEARREADRIRKQEQRDYVTQKLAQLRAEKGL